MYLSIDNQQYYAYTGTHELRDDLETIVFVHGASMDHSVWSHQSRYFAYHGYNVVAVDLPGHRFSKGQLMSRVEDMSDWLLDILKQCNGTGFHLVGHSMGSLVCGEAAANYNHRNSQPLLSLSMVGFSYPMSVTPQLMDAAQNNPSKAYSMMTQWSHTSKIGGEPVPGFWSPGMQMSMMENSAEGSIYANLQACDNYKGGEAAFDKVQCPILFISGRLDKMAPAKLAKQVADSKDNADIVMIPNCGHSIMSESPDGVLDNLKRFIERNAVRP